jgi:hypothetical protein
MVVVRIVVAVLVLVLAGLIGMWIFSSDRRFLRYAWQLLRVGILALAIFFGLMMLERFLPL